MSATESPKAPTAEDTTTPQPTVEDTTTSTAEDTTTSTAEDTTTSQPTAEDTTTPQPTPDQNQEDTFEAKHVHDVYESIAGHFSHTRYKPWPQVEKFLMGMAPGSVWADCGCGNGKYLHVRRDDTYAVGSDFSTNLVDICRSRGLEALVSDVLSLPYRSDSFDHCICIAVIHHMSTPQRRIAALRELARIVKPGGTFLVTVWAREQDKFREKLKGTNGDMFVPWKMNADRQKIAQEQTAKGGVKRKASSTIEGEFQVFQRYYHLYAEGELCGLVESAGNMSVVEHGYERDNWWAVVKKL